MWHWWVLGALAQNAEPNRVEEQTLEALLAYKQQRLVWGSQVVVGTSYVPTGNTYIGSPYAVRSQSVYSGSGRSYSSDAFARLVGDEEMLTQLKRKRTRDRGLAVGIVVIGAAVTTTGGLAIAANDPVDNSVNIRAGVTMVSLGSLVAALGLLPGIGVTRRRSISAVYEPNEVDAWMGRYNAELAKELGLSREQVLKLELEE